MHHKTKANTLLSTHTIPNPLNIAFLLGLYLHGMRWFRSLFTSLPVFLFCSISNDNDIVNGGLEFLIKAFTLSHLDLSQTDCVHDTHGTQIRYCVIHSRTHITSHIYLSWDCVVIIIFCLHSCVKSPHFRIRPIYFFQQFRMHAYVIRTKEKKRENNVHACCRCCISLSLLHDLFIWI